MRRFEPTVLVDRDSRRKEESLEPLARLERRLHPRVFAEGTLMREDLEGTV